MTGQSADANDVDEILRTRTDDGIEVLTLNRPRRRNSLSPALTAGLHRHLDRIAGDATCRAVVLTGKGDSFCAGVDMRAGEDPPGARDSSGTPAGDLAMSVQGDMARHMATQEHMASLFAKMHRLRQPVIAAINGHAVGGGFAMALAADIRLASPEARFGAVFIERGVSACDMGTSYFLPRLVGGSRAAELMLTGRVFDAAEAMQIGLLTEVVERGQLVERAIAKAADIVRHSPVAVWMTKETMWQTIDSPSLRQALDLENRTQMFCLANGELMEAFAAFAERRTASWRPL